MRILSIGFGDKKKVKYEKVNNAGITETYQLSTEDDFRPEILEAYVKARALVIETFKVFKLFEEEWLKIKSISFTCTGRANAKGYYGSKVCAYNHK